MHVWQVVSESRSSACHACLLCLGLLFACPVECSALTLNATNDEVSIGLIGLIQVMFLYSSQPSLSRAVLVPTLGHWGCTSQSWCM